MPIKPENKHRYPANWKEIRDRVVLDAMDRCEDCGVANGTKGYRGLDGEFHALGEQPAVQRAVAECIEAVCPSHSLFRIVLTVHHLDEQPENNAPDNLVALCQKCHLDKHRPGLHSPQLAMDLDRLDYEAEVNHAAESSPE